MEHRSSDDSVLPGRFAVSSSEWFPTFRRLRFFEASTNIYSGKDKVKAALDRP